MTPFRAARVFQTTVPWVSLKVPEVINTETGADMAVFEAPGRLVSRAGVCPGSNKSAGRVKSAQIVPGNKYLKAALGTIALSACRSKNSYVAAKYRRISARRGRRKRSWPWNPPS